MWSSWVGNELLSFFVSPNIWPINIIIDKKHDDKVVLKVLLSSTISNVIRGIIFHNRRLHDDLRHVHAVAVDSILHGLLRVVAEDSAVHHRHVRIHHRLPILGE